MRAHASVFLVVMGAGAENFLVALATEGLGSVTVSSSLLCQQLVLVSLMSLELGSR